MDLCIHKVQQSYPMRIGMVMKKCSGLVSDGICSSPPIVELIRDDNDGSAKSSRITHYSSS